MAVSELGAESAGAKPPRRRRARVHVRLHADEPHLRQPRDRLRRKRLIGAGVALWSFAPVLSGTTRLFATMFPARLVVGVGQASYATLSPTIIDDLAPLHRRTEPARDLLCRDPVGSALGYMLVGFLEPRFGWRSGLLHCGRPGRPARGDDAPHREPAWAHLVFTRRATAHRALLPPLCANRSSASRSRLRRAPSRSPASARGRAAPRSSSASICAQQHHVRLHHRRTGLSARGGWWLPFASGAMIARVRSLEVCAWSTRRRAVAARVDAVRARRPRSPRSVSSRSRSSRDLADERGVLGSVPAGDARQRDGGVDLRDPLARRSDPAPRDRCCVSDALG